jgi:PKD repeat protein
MDTMTKSSMTQANPVADFSSSNACEGDSVSFTNETQFAGNSDNLSYGWDFGDNTTSTEMDPSNVYSDSGDYNVRLATSTDMLGCSDTMTSTVLVNRKASATFTKTSEQGGEVTFEADDTTAASYDWEFGDGNTGQGINPTHTYDNNDTYDVTLTTTTQAGCEQSNTQSLIVDNVDGIAEVSNVSAFEVYPNPTEAGEAVKVKYSLKAESQISLSVYNTNGKRIEVLADGNRGTGDHEHEFKPGNESGGIYMIRLMVDNKMQVRKVIQTE